METADLTGIVIFAVLSVAVVSFCILAYFILGPYKKLLFGEKVLVIVGLFGVLATLILAAIQLLFGFLI